MSVVMPTTRDLPAGPTAGLLPCKAEADDHQDVGGPVPGGRPLLVNGFLGRRRPGDSSGSSSSIGVPEDSSDSPSEEEDDENEDHAEVQSTFRPARQPLRTLGSLEESLPIKRGLSSHFNGKSKSFASLADVVTKPTATAADLAKPENPFNKRRRILMMAKRSQMPRRASCSSLMLNDGRNGDNSNNDGDDGNDYSSPPRTAAAAGGGARFPPPPLRPLQEEDGEESDNDDDPSTTAWRMLAPLPPPSGPRRRLSLEGSGRPLSSFRSPRSYSLTDLQKHQHDHNDSD